MQTETITAKATVAAPTPPANNSVGIYYGECTLYENEIYLFIFLGVRFSGCNFRSLFMAIRLANMENVWFVELKLI